MKKSLGENGQEQAEAKPTVDRVNYIVMFGSF